MSDEQTGVPEGWSVVVDSPKGLSGLQQIEGKPDTSSALKLAAAGTAVSSAGKLAQGATDVASRLRFSPSVALDQFSLNQPQKALKALSLTGLNPLKPPSAVTNIANRIAPYAQTLSTLGGAQGVLDLAQMAEPNRKDIGFMGIGSGTPDPQHPALLNDLAAKVRDYIMSKMGAQDPNAGGHP